MINILKRTVIAALLSLWAVTAFAVQPGCAPIGPCAGVAIPVPVPVRLGGIGITSGTSGGILGFTGTGTIASSVLLTQYGPVIGGGAGATPTAVTPGTNGQILLGNTGAAPAFATAGGVFTMAANGTSTIVANGVPLTGLAQSALNTMLGNWTGGTANVLANTMPSCADSGGNHLNYVNGTGITCGTSSSLTACPTKRTYLTSGSGATYTTSTCNSNLPTSIFLRMVGGGTGGAGSGTTPGTVGGASATTWSGTPQSAGAGGIPTTQTGGAGGSTTGCDLNQGGTGGGPAFNAGNSLGGLGGVSAFGGAGPGGTTTGQNAVANSGSGGGGAGQTVTGAAGGGGASGGYCEKTITSPASSYTYTVGAGSNGGTLGTGGSAGGNGAAGLIIVQESWD